jgi:beta-lactamase regulating signal transducer with metallopeptidase domain
MIAAWMLYTVAVSLLLYAGARGTEYLARAVGMPTRFVWVAAIAAAFVLSGRALSSGCQPLPRVASPAAGSETIRQPARASVNRAAPGAVQRLLIIRDDAMRAPTAVSRRVDVAPLERWNDVLLAVWVAMSVIAIAYLSALLFRLRGLADRMRPVVVDARLVLLSNDVGPAVLGMIRSRIVLPEWVLSLPRHERHVILAHEREHADAFDPALLGAAAVAIALQPWNAGLWAMFAGLKLAIESDCDRRVLGTTGDARAYGQLLVAVYQRTTYGHAPYTAFVQRPSNLERRILRMTRAPRLMSVSAGAAALGTMVLCTAAWVAPAPSRAAAVRTLQHIEQARAIVWTLPAVRIAASPANATSPSKTMRPDVGPLPIKVSLPAPTIQTSPCLFAGMMSGTGMPPRPKPPEGCTVDGEILVLALDDSHVMIAARDSTDIAFDGSDYIVFGTPPGAVPADLSWFAPNGHLKFDADLYIASPSPGKRSIAFISPKGSDSRYPDALHFRMGTIRTQRNGGLKWNVLRQLPGAPRCNAAQADGTTNGPLIYVDGTRVDNGPCFVVDGTPVVLW